MLKKNSRNQEDEGIAFFGKVTASLSHEIKNVLAIINENAGLLEDLTLLAEKGRPLELERVRLLAGKVKTQVLRGDGIVRNMNRFAHSVDLVLEQVDLGEVTALVVELAQRLAVMKGVSLEATAPAERVRITTNPFLLEKGIWNCLSLAMEEEPRPKVIGLVPESLEKGAQIRLTGLQGIYRSGEDAFMEGIRKAIPRDIESDLVTDQESGDILIRLPLDISGGEGMFSD